MNELLEELPEGGNAVPRRQHARAKPKADEIATRGESPKIPQDE